MLLKREEKDGKIDAVYNSSNILSSTYDKTTKDLVITFNKGAKYKYPNVETTDYTRFELAESQGVVFNSHIKKYPFEKLEAIDVAEMSKQISDLKAQELKEILAAKQAKLIQTVTCLTMENSLGLLSVPTLTKLQGEITDYLTQLKQD